MPAPRQFSEKQLRQLLQAFHSDKGGTEVAKQHGISFHPTLRRLWVAEFGEPAYRQRVRRLCRLQQLGTKNSMAGRFGALHPNYKPVHISNFGYRHVDAPEWYTGPVDKGKVAEHILVACQAAGLTELPEFHVVHHKDENKRNNAPANLEIVSRASHAQIHRWARHKRKVQRLSLKGVGSK